MKKILRYLLVVLIALVLGIGSALLFINIVPKKSSIKNGAWTTNPLTQSNQDYREILKYLFHCFLLIVIFTIISQEVLVLEEFIDQKNQLMLVG